MGKTSSTAPTAFEMLSKFTYLRQTGMNRDDAWYTVCDAALGVNDQTLKAFLNLAKNWERREGYKYKYASPTPNDDTLPPGEAAPITREIPQPGPVAPPRAAALTGTLDPARLRAYEQNRLEQVLDQIDDLPDEPAAPPHPAPASPGRTAPIGYRPDFFGPRTALLMYFKNRRDPLRVRIAGETELFIGRSTANAAMAPEIDLSVVNGADLGVSRMHAAITRRHNQLLITDLESVNFTFVNGIRLLNNEVRVLQDGDEIWFGQLHCRIRFQQF